MAKKMTRVELLALFDEIIAILESEGSAMEKLESIEAAMFEPMEARDETDDGDDDRDGGRT